MEKSEFDRRLGLYVRELRTKKGWSQQILASKMGNNFQNISRLERGEVSPTFFWIDELATVFEMKLKDFVEGFENQLLH
ncbi:MAG: helix-turn-helix domain-containing protein [Crocinitomicaceae bacterium]|nr:helix-turn-helix domain-containing protein [Crocinitomicaceae bacterium]MCF8433296.1 helix-turn-helix domain-containing protein [Crocinitomicaceae bacterium]